MTSSQSPATAPVILWLHRELRLRDNPALEAAMTSGRPVLPVFILDDQSPGAWKIGGAQRWWLHHSLERLGADFAKAGAPLLLRRGATAETLIALANETGATEIHGGLPIEQWARTETDTLARHFGDRLHLHRTALLHEPESIRTGSGGPYTVYTPFSKACRARGEPPAPRPAPSHIAGGGQPRGDSLSDWRLLPNKPDWSAGLRESWTPGEAGAADRLKHVVAEIVEDYADTRDFPGRDGTSRLSPHLHFGEISPGDVWHAAARTGSGRGVTTFHNEILWREFSAHLLVHFPDLPDEPLRKNFNSMPWDHDAKALRAWQTGRTGIPIVDAGMRQLWSIGWMHNRVRMIVASFLTKHMLIPWQDGETWFWDTLVDADLASNSAQWQWVAGCGADAAPYFRVFNPVLQGKKFDPDGDYVRRWVAELTDLPTKYIHAPWEAPDGERPNGYPPPLIDLNVGRARALDAFEKLPKSAA